MSIDQLIALLVLVIMIVQLAGTKVNTKSHLIVTASGAQDFLSSEAFFVPGYAYCEI